MDSLEYNALQVKYITAVKLLQGYKEGRWEIKFQELSCQMIGSMQDTVKHYEMRIAELDQEVEFWKRLAFIKCPGLEGRIIIKK